MKKAAALIGGQLELSKKTGISSRSINAYVMESADPAREKVVAMAKAAGVSVAWLAAGIGPMQPGQEEMEKGVQGEEENSLNIQQLLNMTAKVLLSDTIYRPALAANIKAFSRSIDIELDNKEMRGKIDRLEERMAAMERRLDTRKAAGNE